MSILSRSLTPAAPAIMTKSLSHPFATPHTLSDTSIHHCSHSHALHTKMLTLQSHLRHQAQNRLFSHAFWPRDRTAVVTSRPSIMSKTRFVSLVRPFKLHANITATSSPSPFGSAASASHHSPRSLPDLPLELIQQIFTLIVAGDTSTTAEEHAARLALTCKTLALSFANRPVDVATIQNGLIGPGRSMAERYCGGCRKLRSLSRCSWYDIFSTKVIPGSGRVTLKWAETRG